LGKITRKISFKTKKLEKAKKAAPEANSGSRGVKGPPKWSNCLSIDEFKTTLEKYTNSGISDPSIGEIYGVSAQTIHSWRNKLNISKRRSEIRDENWLRYQYIDLKKSCSEIAKEVGCTGTAIQAKLKEYNIPIRNAFERQKLANIKRIKTN